MNNQGLLSRRTTALSRTVVVVFLVLQVQSPTRGASLGQNDPSEDASQSCGYGVGNFPHIQLTNLMVQAEGSENLLEAAVMVHGCVSGSNYRLKTSVLAVETETKFTHSRSSYEPLQIQIKCADLSVEAQSDSPPLLHFELFGQHPAVSQCSVSLSGLITSVSFPLELSGPLLSCKNTAANKGPSVPDQHSKKEIDNSAEQPIEPEKKDRSSRKRKQISSLTEFNFLGPYQPRPDLWMSWWPPAFERVSKRMNHFNIERMQNSVSPDEADDKVYGEGPVRFSLDFPTYVMNLPSRSDRRNHMERLLPALGFTDIRFPETTHKSQIDVEALLKEGKVERAAITEIEGMDGREAGQGKLNITSVNAGPVRAYLANALDQSKVIQEHAQKGTPFFAILEDDLMPAAANQNTNRRIADAIHSLSPTADMLFLEYCLEDCARLRYPPMKAGVHQDSDSDEVPAPGIALAHRPYCSGGIVFTAKGARKLARLLSPVFSSLDAMYAELSMHSNVEAYVAVPPIFYQDSFWGSDANRTLEHLTLQRSGPSEHAMLATACKQFDALPVASTAELVRYSEVAELLEQRPELQPAFEAASWWAAPSSASFIFFDAFPLMHWAPAGTGAVLLIMPSDRLLEQPVFEEVAAWKSPAQERIAVMVDDRSYCPPREDGGLCLLELYRVDEEGEFESGVRVQLLVERL